MIGVFKMSKINDDKQEFVTVNNLKRFLQNADERFAPNKNMEGIKSDGSGGYIAGKSGLVPAPPKSSNGKFLRSDGTWVAPGESSVYNTMDVAEGTAGTSTTDRVINAKNLKEIISSQVPTKVSELDNDSNFLTNSELSAHTDDTDIHVTPTEKTTWNNKANKATTLSGYGITDAYTKTQVDTKISNLVNSAPETLDTLNELASALGNDPNFATAVATQIGNKANDSDVVHKSGDETIAGSKTFNSQIKGNISGTSSDVVVGSDTATARGYLVDSKLPWYTWEEGSQVVAGSKPLITDFNNLTKPGVYHVVFCLNDGFIHKEKEYKESLNRPSMPDSTTGFRDGILEIKQTTTMDTISAYDRFIQKLTVLGNSSSTYINLTYQRVCIRLSSNAWTAWKRVARDEEVVHTSGNETIKGDKYFDGSFVNVTGYRFRVKGTNQEIGVIPTDGNKWNGFGFYDKNNKSTFSIENGHITDGTTKLSFKLAKNADGVVNELGIFLEASYGPTADADKPLVRVHNLNPFKDNAYTLGTSTLKWKAVYANSVVVNDKNVLTDANQIMMCKNVTGSNIALGGVVDCGDGNEKLKAWCIDESNTLTLDATKVTGKWKNISSYMVPQGRSGMFIKIG